MDSAAGPPGAVIAPEACQEERRGRGRSEEGAAGAVLVTTLRRLRRRGKVFVKGESRSRMPRFVFVLVLIFQLC